MRYQNRNVSPWKESQHRTMYVAIARWGNQPNIFKKMSFRQFCEANQALHKTEGTLCSSMAALLEFERKFPDIAKKYFDLRYDEFNQSITVTKCHDTTPSNIQYEKLLKQAMGIVDCISIDASEKIDEYISQNLNS